MVRIGIRELRQHASRWVARAAAGEIVPARGSLPNGSPLRRAEPLTPHLEAGREERV
ncbi:MAG TPA: hypothetical protein VK894_11280 [Jiangellales bacterium]|nr:hypothetical protein [Jiangellales bacterium]